MGFAIAWLVDAIIGVVFFLVIAQAILSWLIAFNVVNTRNRVVWQIARSLDALTEPLLRPLRRVIPSFGGVDVTPIVLLLGLQFLQIVLRRVVWPPLIAALG